MHVSICKKLIWADRVLASRIFAGVDPLHRQSCNTTFCIYLIELHERITSGAVELQVYACHEARLLHRYLTSCRRCCKLRRGGRLEYSDRSKVEATPLERSRSLDGDGLLSNARRGKQ
jgi:hypothetical protein